MSTFNIKTKILSLSKKLNGYSQEELQEHFKEQRDVENFNIFLNWIKDFNRYKLFTNERLAENSKNKYSDYAYVDYFYYKQYFKDFDVFKLIELLNFAYDNQIELLLNTIAKVIKNRGIHKEEYRVPLTATHKFKYYVLVDEQPSKKLYIDPMFVEDLKVFDRYFVDSEAYLLDENMLNLTFDKIQRRQYHDLRESDYIIVPNGVKEIPKEIFKETYAVKYIAIPDSVVNVGKYAFSYCKRLKTIVLNNVETIGDSAFNHCEHLESVKMPNVKTIGAFAFHSCKRLTDIGTNKDNSVYISNNISTIETGSFSCCYNLKEINLPESVEEIKTKCFVSCMNLRKINASNLKNIGQWSFCRCDKLKDIEIKEGCVVHPEAFKANQ